MSGLVEYEAVSARYAPQLDRVLQEVSFKARPLEKIAIVGRTGAGKSSLALTLLRGLEVECGCIRIDGLNICEIDIYELRRLLAYVPQDPTLFAGTLSRNLDPLNENTDEQILTALGRVGMLEEAQLGVSNHGDWSAEKRKFGNFSFTLEHGGSNISQGQRQLVCIARVGGD